MCTAICDLNLTRQAFLDLTMWEFHILLDYHFSIQKKNDAQLMRNVIINAGANLMRKEGSAEIPLFKNDNEKTEEDIINERDELFK